MPTAGVNNVVVLLDVSATVSVDPAVAEVPALLVAMVARAPPSGTVYDVEVLSLVFEKPVLCAATEPVWPVCPRAVVSK